MTTPRGDTPPPAVAAGLTPLPLHAVSKARESVTAAAAAVEM